MKGYIARYIFWYSNVDIKALAVNEDMKDITVNILIMISVKVDIKDITVNILKVLSVNVDIKDICWYTANID